MTAAPITLQLPWPPSINTYWRRVGNKTILSKKAREYRTDVADIICEHRTPRLGTARLRVTINAHPPDKRQRDLDNLPKGVLDSLAHAGIFKNDAQIDSLTITRMPTTPGGSLTITLEPLMKAPA